MTEKVKNYREYVLGKKHISCRKEFTGDPKLFTSGPYHERMKNRFLAMLEAQDIVFLPDEMFIPTRTTGDLGDIFAENDPAMNKIKNEKFVHESGWLSNLNPDYGKVISGGFKSLRAEIAAARTKTDDKEKLSYAETLVAYLDAISAFAGRYREAAREKGLNDIADTLERIPENGARTYREALQFFRLIHFCLWLEGDYHVTVGRFDKYMYGYFKSDLESGRLTYDEALEMTENFFISFNKDCDLYSGMQQGDNGQSMMLGGRDENGCDEYNELSELCLVAATEVKTIDPKINLRVDKNTPHERFVLASRLTATGMGFPQYSNDDVVIPGLIALGYAPEDACDYTVAACWEFIIPGKAMDIPNIGALSFPDVVNTVIRRDLEKCEDFSDFLIFVDKEIKDRLAAFPDTYRDVFFRPAPFMTLCSDFCIDELKDITLGNKYNNFGIHGVGLSCAADSIAAVNALVFNGFTEPKELIRALDDDFVGHEKLRNRILTKIPHMGNNDDSVDCYGEMLLSSFAEALAPLRNSRGGVFRPGTGSAFFYAKGREVGATADGRRKDDYLPANYSPSLYVKLDGPFSVISSFTKPDLSKTVNGGPLTLELAPNAVKDDEGIEKTAFMVKKFIELGGHQMQLNVVNKEKLTDAQKHPELYKNLVVRVWGWSGYFTELDKVYQDQILRRADHEL